jgi:hypothetical protein
LTSVIETREEGKGRGRSRRRERREEKVVSVSSPYLL